MKLYEDFKSCNRDVDRGGGPEPRPEFVRPVNPIQTRGADYAPHTTASPPDSKSYIHLCVTTSTKNLLKVN